MKTSFENYNQNCSITDRIAALMQQKGVTQAALADLIGKDKGTVSRYMKQQGEFSISDLVIIADLFSISLDDLCGHARKEKTDTDKVLDYLHAVIALFESPFPVDCVQVDYEENKAAGVSYSRLPAVVFPETVQEAGIINQFLDDFKTLFALRESLPEVAYNHAAAGLLENAKDKLAIGPLSDKLPFE